jgi:hypothetical protein
MVLHRLTQRTLVVGLSLTLLLGAVPPAHAESVLSMRQTILTQQRDRVLISLTARIGPIGTVHTLSADCDVHVPLIAPALFLAILGEVKNACSMGPTKAQLVAMGSGPMPVEGAFRIWFEGHDAGIPFREEDGDVPEEYDNSGPPHLVELHPITRLGTTDLLPNVRLIEKDGQTIAWKKAESFRRAATRKLTIRRRTIGGKRYILMRCACPPLANHFKLRVEIVFTAHPTDNGDGIVATGKVFDDDGDVIRARVRLFAIQGTPAALVLEDVAPGEALTVYGLARLSLRPLLSRVRSTERVIDMPVELLLLHVEPQ